VDSRGRKGVPLVWRLAKEQVHPRLENFRYDLGTSRGALLSLLRGVAPGLEDVRFLQPRIEASHLVVPLAVAIPDTWLASAAAGASVPAATAAPLSEAELEALDKALQPWDAFL